MSQQTDFDLLGLEKLGPLTDASTKPGQYLVKYDQPEFLVAKDNHINHKIWFKSPPLIPDIVQRITKIQLFASSHDQGDADDKLGGNWTWFELAILEAPASQNPRVKDGIELVWRSHRNNFLTKNYKWKEGNEFDGNHDLLSQLEPNNVIAVRLCARFSGWEIDAKEGLLVFDIGADVIEREPVNYAKTVARVQTVHSTMQEVNVVMGAAFQPTLPPTQLFFRADTFGTANEPPLRVLSLDGGGVRGMASLRLLQAVMKKLAPGKTPPKPCDVFDIIGGTSTGGLIAIMLGRLRMSVDEAIQKYDNFISRIFPEKITDSNIKMATNTVWKGGFYDADILAQITKDIVKERLGKNDELLLEKPSDSVPKPCKVFCMATRQDAANNRGPVFLRSYVNPHDKSLIPEVKIWEAARATSAAPAYFKPITVGDYTLVDGGLGANNPIGWMWTEVLGLFGPARSTACFLSIGTGIPPNSKIDASISGAMNMMSTSTNTQIAHLLFRTLIDAFAPAPLAAKYFRLNIGREDASAVPKGKEGKDLQSFKQMGEMDDVATLRSASGALAVAEEYIKLQDGPMSDCAKCLVPTIVSVN